MTTIFLLLLVLLVILSFIASAIKQVWALWVTFWLGIALLIAVCVTTLMELPV